MTTTALKIFGLALLVSSSAIAQDAKDNGRTTKTKYMSVGPVIGFGHSWVSNNVNNFKPSAQLGVGMIYSRDEHWGHGSTLTISHEGFADEYYMYGNTYENTYNPVYLRFTPRVYYFFGDYQSTVRPKVYLGPSVAYKVAEERYMNPEGQSIIEGQVINPPTTFRSFDFGVNAGAGVNIKLAKYTWLNLDADYYHGLIDVTKAMDNNKGRSLRANVGVMIGI